SVLQSQKWRFKYGRQATEARIEDIELPLIEKISELWVSPKIELERIIIDFPQLMDKLNGKKLRDIFTILKGKGCYFQKCRVGKTPMISASEMDNGVIGFVDLPPAFKAPCITIERITAKAHVQTVDFVTVPDDIFVLKPKHNLIVDELFFIATILNVNRWRFGYSRKVTKPRLENILFHIDMEKKLAQVVMAPSSHNKPLTSFT
ncbi:MAG: restriction endonuclease subunit S, partial [Methanocellales archaeon]|nr:restriction endonuclease subunit S [Methanocellales archaeon]